MNSSYPQWMEKFVFCSNWLYLLPLPTNQRIKPTTRTIKMIAVQKPALKIPSTNSQELSVIAITIAQSHIKEYCLMSSYFSLVMQKLCRYFFWG